jgi:hypothetical protein
MNEKPIAQCPKCSDNEKKPSVPSLGFSGAMFPWLNPNGSQQSRISLVTIMLPNLETEVGFESQKTYLRMEGKRFRDK